MTGKSFDCTGKSTKDKEVATNTIEVCMLAKVYVAIKFLFLHIYIFILVL